MRTDDIELVNSSQRTFEFFRCRRCFVSRARDIVIAVGNAAEVDFWQLKAEEICDTVCRFGQHLHKRREIWQERRQHRHEHIAKRAGELLNTRFQNAHAVGSGVDSTAHVSGNADVLSLLYHRHIAQLRFLRLGHGFVGLGYALAVCKLF